jgi:hypothetical protein
MEDNMDNEETTRGYGRTTTRNVARVISSLVAGFILLFTVGQWISELFYGKLGHDWELSSTGMVVYVVLITLGTIIGWRREKIGGIILIVAGLGMLAAILIFLPTHDYWVSLIFSFPFLLSGALYLTYRNRSQPRKG